MPTKGECVKLKNFERKLELPFMIYADFETILIPEESYTTKYQKHAACSYGCKLVCVDGKFGKPFKSY